MSNTAHATLSPSKRVRWSVCPGSVRLEAQYPDTSGPAAVDGTHTHTLLERCITDKLVPMCDPLSLVGFILEDHEGKFTIDKARAERVKVAIDYIQSVMGGGTVIAESRVDPAPLVGRFDMAGTADVQIHGDDWAEVIDYKDGGGIVEVAENPQLLQYAVGMVAGKPDHQWRTIRLTIVQPKLVDRGMKAVQSWDIPIERIAAEAEKLKVEGAKCDKPDAPLVPGESQCRYCKAKGNCPAVVNKVMSDVGLMFHPIEKAQVLDIAQQSADKNPETMSDQQLRQILDAAPLMRQMLESAEDEALKRLKAGKSIAGLKLVNGRGSRSWNLSDEEIAPKLIKVGIPKGSVYVTKVVSPAQCEKLTWSKKDGTRVQLTPRQLERIDKEYITKMGGKLTVVSESDSRPAVTMDASPMFAAVTTEVAPAAPDVPAWLS